MKFFKTLFECAYLCLIISSSVVFLFLMWALMTPFIIILALIDVTRGWVSAPSKVKTQVGKSSLSFIRGGHYACAQKEEKIQGRKV